MSARWVLIGAAVIAVALVLLGFATGMRLNTGSPPVLEFFVFTIGPVGRVTSIVGIPLC